MTRHLIKVLKAEYLEFNLGHFPDIKTLQQLVEQRINKIVGEELTIVQFLEYVEGKEQ